MTCVRHMALWLAAVIVLIAVGLVPSGAQAHAGHPHAAPAATGLIALPPVATDEARGGDVRMIVPDAVIRTVVLLSASPARALSDGVCDGSCCNSGCRTNSCCTGTGLAPDSAEAAGPRCPGDRALARALPTRTDFVPEALPEPPRA